MFTCVDLCAGTGALRKAFERTGAYKCIMSAEIDPNMRNLYYYLFDSQIKQSDIIEGSINAELDPNLRTIYGPLFDTKIMYSDIFGEACQEALAAADYDVLLAGLNGLGEDIFFKIMETIERDLPKAFVLELDTTTLQDSLKHTCIRFFEKNNYYIIDEKLNLLNFGIPEYCERVFLVGANKDHLRVNDPLFLQIRSEHDYECYKYKEFDPTSKIEQKRGLDWGFHNFRFLKGTPERNKEEIVENATPIPMACTVALDLMNWIR